MSNPKSKIEAHNNALAQHYTNMGKNLDGAAWSGVIARNLSRPLRPNHKATLEEMGLNISGTGE
jgi:hypothetical protein